MGHTNGRLHAGILYSIHEFVQHIYERKLLNNARKRDEYTGISHKIDAI